MGGFFFDFEAVRTDLTEMLRAGPDGAVRRPGAVAAGVRGLVKSAALVPGAAATRECGGGTSRGRCFSRFLPERGLDERGLGGGGRDPGDAHGVRARRPRAFTRAERARAFS